MYTLASISVGAIVGIVVGVVALIIVIALISWWIVTYNKLVKAKQKVANGWSQIEVQLKKRFDLVPNLVETVKGYASHEKETLGDVTMWRSKVAGANSTQEKIDANNGLTEALSRLMVSVEAYPDLKANANFISLQNELSDIESKIAFARQFYNDTAQKNNELIEMFPSKIIANAYNFKAAPYYQVEEAAYTAPKVSFN